MSAQERVPREVYVRRRAAVGVAALLLVVGGVAGAAQLDGDGSAGTAGTLEPVSSSLPQLVTPVSELPVTQPSTDSASVGTDPTSSPVQSTEVTSAAPQATAERGGAPSVDAAAFAVYDDSTGQWLAEQRADDPVAVGSVMKLLTAKVVMDDGDLTKVVTVPDLQMDPMESAIGLYEGEQLPRDVLLRAMLIVSANDAARALAVDVGGSQDGFVEQMNETAEALGLENTFATNPVGLDSGNAHSSARDMVKLGELLMEDETFRTTVARTSANLHGQAFASTNDLLAGYPGADGIKTGHTTDAGYCLLGSATRDGKRIIVAVMGSSTDAAREAAASALLDWGFAQS